MPVVYFFNFTKHLVLILYSNNSSPVVFKTKHYTNKTLTATTKQIEYQWFFE